MLATHASVALIIVSVVLSFGSVTGAELRLPAELHENLDLISVMEVEGATSSAVRDATEGAVEVEQRKHETQQHRAAPDLASQHDDPEVFHGGNPHETQMDDLFGDMRQQQDEEQQIEHTTKADNERFEVKPSPIGGGKIDDIGESSGSGEADQIGAAAAPAEPLLASTETQIQPGVDEVQSYSTGYVAEELQIGSQNGILADSQHGFTPQGAKVPRGRVVLFGKKSGLFLDADTSADENTWSLYSDADEESGGVCLMTAHNNDVKGLKVCHTEQSTGMWASGNVGITGNLMLEGSTTVVDVQRLQLRQTDVGPNGYVLKVGGQGPALTAGVSHNSAWMQVTEQKTLLLNPAKGNVGFGTETPAEKMHVAGTMAVNHIFVGHTSPVLAPNQLTLKSGTGWEMTDSDWLRVINNKGIEGHAGAYFTDKVGVNFNWKTMPSEAKLRVNDGKLGVTRMFGHGKKGVAFFYDDKLGEGRVYARDFKKNAWAPMRWEADAIIFNPEGNAPIAIGTRTPKANYLLHIEGNNKVDGHIYVAKKMKVGGKAHVANMHTPRLSVKDEYGRDGSGREPADGVKDFVVGEWQMKGKTYELKPGGTNLRLGYWKDYCWMQMWPKGPTGSPLVLNGAGNRVGFGTTHPLTNTPGSGSEVLFHVDGNLLVRGNLVVKGEIKSGSDALEAESLLDIGFEDSAHMLNHLNAQKPKSGGAHFGDSKMHKGAVSVSHIAATLTRSLQHHQAMLETHEGLLTQHEDRLSKLDKAISQSA